MRTPKKIIDPSFTYGHYWIPPDRGWLEDQYLTQEKSARKIAREVGSSRTVVDKWLRRSGIPLRTKEGARGLQAGPISGRSVWWHKEQARKILRELGVPKVCARCGTSQEGYLDVHHKDGNRQNHVPSNLQYLCCLCHSRVHAGWYD